MRKLTILCLLMGGYFASAQELFVMTEPASNVPAGSISARIGQSLMKEQYDSGYNYHMMPKVTWGINKSWMVRATAYISNRNTDLVTEGGGLYAKYRFLSSDDLQSHFRMAAFGRYSMNNADIHQEEIETMGHNTGVEAGIIATKLIKKLAISSTVSYEKAFDNRPDNDFPSGQASTAINYSLSLGRLMYPKTYTSYKQTNINLMVELLGQTLAENGRSYLDVVPSVQFIINSQARIDVAYKQELYSSMLRSAPNGIYLKLEYTFFNVTN